MPEQIFSGKYVVQEEIARGGMGVIYKALDRTLNRIVAIKRIHAHLSGDASFSERFMREARAMARLQHDNIVTIYSVEEDQQTQFLVMEFFGPTNLRTLVRQPHRLPLRDVVHIGYQLSTALAYAHGQSIIHRDIKPANVLINKRGKAKLTDFGIAAALDEASITSTGQVIGTPEYMSPEQARGTKLDGRSDLYSLGVMLYEMLCGKPPYADTSKTAILGKLVFEQQEITLQFPAEVPSLLQGVVRDLLRRNPDERIPDADILASQLHEILYTLPDNISSPLAIESETTFVSAAVKSTSGGPILAPPPLTEHVSEPTTRTALTERTQLAESPAPPPPQPAVPPAPLGLDETTLLPPKPPIPPQTRGFQPSPALPPTPTRPLASAFPIMPLVGGGIVLVAVLVGLISYLASGPESSVSQQASLPPSSATAPLSQSDTGREPIDTTPSQAEELEQQRQQLAEETRRLDEKKRLAEAQQAKEDAARREQERQRDLAAQRLKDEEQKRQAAEAEKARLAAALQAKEDAARREQERQRDLAAQRLKDEEQKRVASSPPPIQVAKTFPDPRLQSLLEQFRSAYERRDLGGLKSLSRMDDARLRQVDFMFTNYRAFTASIQNIVPTEEGATAVLILQTGTRVTGETIKIPPLSSRYTLHIPRHGEEWEKVVW